MKIALQLMCVSTKASRHQLATFQATPNPIKNRRGTNSRITSPVNTELSTNTSGAQANSNIPKSFAHPDPSPRNVTEVTATTIPIP